MSGICSHVSKPVGFDTTPRLRSHPLYNRCITDSLPTRLSQKTYQNKSSRLLLHLVGIDTNSVSDAPCQPRLTPESAPTSRSCRFKEFSLQGAVASNPKSLAAVLPPYPMHSAKIVSISATSSSVNAANSFVRARFDNVPSFWRRKRCNRSYMADGISTTYRTRSMNRS